MAGCTASVLAYCIFRWLHHIAWNAGYGQLCWCCGMRDCTGYLNTCFQAESAPGRTELHWVWGEGLKLHVFGSR